MSNRHNRGNTRAADDFGSVPVVSPGFDDWPPLDHWAALDLPTFEQLPAPEEWPALFPWPDEIEILPDDLPVFGWEPLDLSAVR